VNSGSGRNRGRAARPRADAGKGARCKGNPCGQEPPLCRLCGRVSTSLGCAGRAGADAICLLAGKIEYSEANERKACAEIALNRNTRACTELLTVLYSYLHYRYNNTLEYQRNQEGTLPFVDKNFLV
jgi:hypothetical protein